MKSEHSGDNPKTRKFGLRSILVSVVVPVIMLSIGVAVTMHFMRTSPKAVPRKKPVYQTLVQVERIRFSTEQTVIKGMGSVIAAREVALKPRVSGDVVYLSEEVIPGGVLKEGDTVLKIDPADYQLVIHQLESEVAKAQADMLMEMGNQRVAQKEFELLGEEADDAEKALMLRNPQLKQKEASLKSARSRLAKASLDFERTQLKAPFDSVVRSKSVELGARVTESAPVAQLVGTGSFWVQVGVAVEKLDWIQFPEKGKPGTGAIVRINPRTGDGPNNYRTGRVVRLAADLEENGRMAKVIVEVDDPLCLDPENQSLFPLFLGSYVQAEIEGKTLDQVYRLQRAHMRDGSSIWILTDDGTLAIRAVEPVFKAEDYVLVKDGIDRGEQIIVSNIAVPVAGMNIQLEGQAGSDSQKKGIKGKKPGQMSGPPGKGSGQTSRPPQNNDMNSAEKPGNDQKEPGDRAQ